MSAIEKRDQYAAQILAGFAANPAIFAHNEQCGWCLVNCTDGQIAAYAVRLANELFAATEAIDLNGTAESETEVLYKGSYGYIVAMCYSTPMVDTRPTPAAR